MSSHVCTVTYKQGFLQDVVEILRVYFYVGPTMEGKCATNTCIADGGSDGLLEGATFGTLSG